MSQVDHQENSNPAKTMVPSGKTAAASPKLSAEEHVEMADLPSNGLEDEDIMQLARLGDVAAVQKLFDSGKFDGQYCDGEGITPLHVFAQSPTHRECSTDFLCSGLLSITSMLCVCFCLKMEPT
jgi:hypothetical protein